MKILILTGKFGMGHIKAAEAIKEELTPCQALDIEIIDWIEYMTPLCAKYIYGSYSALIRRSTVFYNLHYKSSENRPITQKPDLACYIRMNQLIHDKQPDLIISVLAYASKAVSYYKALSGSPIPLITCVTDITATSGFKTLPDIYPACDVPEAEAVHEQPLPAPILTGTAGFLRFHPTFL